MTIDQERQWGAEDGIHVEDLGAPEPSPFADEPEEASGPEVSVPGITDEEAGHLLGELIGIPFSFAGSAYAARAAKAVPGVPELPPAIQRIWRLEGEEADRIGGRVFAAIPARFREPARGALERTPLALAAGSIVQAIRARNAASTTAIVMAAAAQEESGDQSVPHPGPQPVPPEARPSGRAADGGGDRQPGGSGRRLDSDDDAAKGLGLSGLVQSRAAERRQRRLAS